MHSKRVFCEEEERQIKEFPKVNAALLTVFLQNRGNLDISSLIFAHVSHERHLGKKKGQSRKALFVYFNANIKWRSQIAM